MKKIVFYIILLILIGMTGCRSSDQEDIRETEADVIEEESEGTLEAINNSSKVTMEEQVLIDEDDIKITALSLVNDTSVTRGPEIYLRIENNSTNNISIEMKEASINAYMVSPVLFCEVAAGEQVEDYVVIPFENLKNSGVDVISTFEFRFYILNTDNNEVVLYSNPITVNTSEKDYVQENDASGEVVYDKGGIKIVYKDIDTSDEFIGPQILFYIENNTDATIAINTENLLANESLEYGALYREITPGKKAVEGITFFDFEGDGFEDIKKIEFTFRISDYDTQDTIDDTDRIRLSFD